MKQYAFIIGIIFGAIATATGITLLAPKMTYNACMDNLTHFFTLHPTYTMQDDQDHITHTFTIPDIKVEADQICSGIVPLLTHKQKQRLTPKPIACLWAFLLYTDKDPARFLAFHGAGSIYFVHSIA